MRQVLGLNYLRVDVALDQIIGLDDVARIDALLAIGDQQPIDGAAFLRHDEPRPA